MNLQRHLSRAAAKLGELREGSKKKTDVHLGEAGFLHQILRQKKLESVFLFVTARCNSKCRTCFYAQEKQLGEDLTFEEIEQIALKAPRFDKLWLSGGEPFLRKDLAQIITLFYRRCGIKSINLPTNGLLTDPVIKVVGQLLEDCPQLTVHLNFSLDGLEATHDNIRGVPGAFQRTLATMRQVEATFGGHPRLHCNCASVVTPQNYRELPALGVYVLENFHLATHFFEIARGDTRDPEVKGLSLAEVEDLHQRLAPLYRRMATRLFAKLPPVLRTLGELYFVGVIQLLYRVQEANLDGPHPWPMACTAGKTTLVIDHDGGLRGCEMRPRFGKIQDYGYDLGAVVRSAELEREIREVGEGWQANCWCTHTCWMVASMQFSPRTLLFEVPRAYLRYLLEQRKMPALPAAPVITIAPPSRSASAASGRSATSAKETDRSAGAVTP